MLHRSPRDSFCLGTFAHGFVILPPRSLAKTRGCLLAKVWILWGVGQFCDHIPAINLVNNCIFFQVTSGYILQAKSFFPISRRFEFSSLLSINRSQPTIMRRSPNFGCRWPSISQARCLFLMTWFVTQTPCVLSQKTCRQLTMALWE